MRCFRKIPCAAHKPPHQKGRRQSAGNCKSVGTASIKACGPHGPVQEALGQILLAADRPRPSRFHKKHYVMKCGAQRKACQNMPPKPSKTQPGMPPNSPKSTSRASWGSQNGPERCFRPGQWRPRSAQEGSRTTQERPKAGQVTAKRHPRVPQTPPRWSLASPKTSF